MKVPQLTAKEGQENIVRLTSYIIVFTGNICPNMRFVVAHAVIGATCHQIGRGENKIETENQSCHYLLHNVRDTSSFYQHC